MGMGLFRKSMSRSGASSSWLAVGGEGGASASADADADAAASGADKSSSHQPLHDSMTSQETAATSSTAATDDGASSTAAADRRSVTVQDVNNSVHVRRLEELVRQRDHTIVRLTETMEAGERVQGDRIALLERQLERLVEMSSPEERARGGTVPPSSSSSSSPPLSPSGGGDGAAARGGEEEERRRSSKLEVSALEELLARVIAEKDRLGFENDNLRAIIAACGGDGSDAMPPTLAELNGGGGSGSKSYDDDDDDDECDEGCSRSRGQATTIVDDVVYSSPPSPAIAAAAAVSPSSSSSPAAAVSSVLPSVLYKMSLRDTAEGGGRGRTAGRTTTLLPLQYLGTYTPKDPAEQVPELTRVLMDHFSQVWRMVLEENGNGPSSSSSPPAGGVGGTGWPTSSLARHCLERCKNFATEEDATRWLMNNLRVEVQTEEPLAPVAVASTVAPGSPKKKRSKSHGRKKSKRKGPKCYEF